MKSALPKVLHPLAGRPLIEHVLRTVDELSRGLHRARRRPRRRRGHGRARAAARRSSSSSSRRSSAPATRCCRPSRRSPARRGTVLLLYADVPLLQSGTLARLLETHHDRARRRDGADGRARRSVRLRAHRPRRDRHRSSRIVEERDASGEERAIREINSGIYAFALAPLFDALRRAGDRQRAGRVLPDRSRRDLPAAQPARRDAAASRRRDELRGVNSRVDLADLGRGAARAQEPRADARRRHARGSRDDLRRRRRRRSARTRSSGPACCSTAARRIGDGCRIHVRRAAHERDRSATT